MRTAATLLVTLTLALAARDTAAQTYTIVDTGQVRCYDHRTEIAYPRAGRACFGQDAHYQGNQPRYVRHDDGTVTDVNTGLMWQADPGPKLTYAQAVAGAAKCRTGGYDDWRLPTIKELYSLIQFSGFDPHPSSRDTRSLRPFIDDTVFRFSYGNTAEGDRIIDSQWATRTVYVGKVMGSQRAMFGVNFADGRIKGYPTGRTPRGDTKTYYVIYVRGNTRYGRNDFIDNGDGTITDRATGLTWMQVDSASLRAGPKRDGKMDWPTALKWAEQLDYAGHNDWRLPNAKELQSIVDYHRSPDTTGSAAIDPLFKATPIRNEDGKTDFGFYWTSTTHAKVNNASAAVYVAFGRALGFMSRPGSSRKTLMDVHGAGAQRSDDKTGDASRFANGRGPQGDVVRITNLVRCVRGGAAKPRTSGPKLEMVYRETANGGPPSGNDFVRRLDGNGDGKVSRGEFDGPADHFRRFDRNRDGAITADEAPTGPPPRKR